MIVVLDLWGPGQFWGNYPYEREAEIDDWGRMRQKTSERHTGTDKKVRMATE
jgi:hypothetical protein